MWLSKISRFLAVGCADSDTQSSGKPIVHVAVHTAPLSVNLAVSKLVIEQIEAQPILLNSEAADHCVCDSSWEYLVGCELALRFWCVGIIRFLFTATLVYVSRSDDVWSWISRICRCVRWPNQHKQSSVRWRALEERHDRVSTQMGRYWLKPPTLFGTLDPIYKPVWFNCVALNCLLLTISPV